MARTADLSHPTRLAAWGLLLALVGCGYRPVAQLTDEGHARAHVPAFESFIGYPELDVYAGSYLRTRLMTMGIRGVHRGDSEDSVQTIQGYLLQARETPIALGSAQTLAELVVDVRVTVRRPGFDEACQTSVAHGRAQLAIPLAHVSESERQTVLRAAVEQAVDALLLEVVLCARPG